MESSVITDRGRDSGLGAQAGGIITGDPVVGGGDGDSVAGEV